MGDFGEWLPTDAVLTGGSGLDLAPTSIRVLWQPRRGKRSTRIGDGVDRLMFVRSGWFGSPPLVDVFWPGDQQTDFGHRRRHAHGDARRARRRRSPAFPRSAATSPAIKTEQPASTRSYFPLDGARRVLARHAHAPRLVSESSNWSFESDDDTLAHWKRYAMLHMALAPYLRSLAQNGARHGHCRSCGRSLCEFPDDAGGVAGRRRVHAGPRRCSSRP